MMGTDEFELRTETLGALPVVNHFLARMGLDRVVDRICQRTTPGYASPRRW